jgi:hypothetical protein
MSSSYSVERGDSFKADTIDTLAAAALNLGEALYGAGQAAIESPVLPDYPNPIHSHYAEQNPAGAASRPRTKP